MSHGAGAVEIVRETDCNVPLPCRTSGEIFAQQMDISRLSEQLKDIIDIVSLMPHTRTSALAKSCSSHLKNFLPFAAQKVYSDLSRDIPSKSAHSPSYRSWSMCPHRCMWMLPTSQQGLYPWTYQQR